MRPEALANPAALPGTVGGLLVRAAGIDEGGLRFLDRKERAEFLTWPQIHERAARVGAALADRGVLPGERVAMILPTSPLFMDAWFGCHLIGAVPVALYPPLRLGRMDEYEDRTVAMLQAASAVAVLTDARVHRVLGVVAQRSATRLGFLRVEQLGAGSAAGDRPVPSDPDALAMVQFSSGTTRSPKPVGLTHRQILASANASLDSFASGGCTRGVGVSWLPLYHDMGLIGSLLPAVMGPVEVTLLKPEDFLLKPALWFRAMSRYRGAVSAGPDFAYGRCLDQIRDDELDGVDLSSWEVAINAAEAISPARMRQFAERFAAWGFRAEALTPSYGLAEAALGVTFGRVGQPYRTLVLDALALTEGRAEPAESGARSVELPSLGPPMKGFAVQIRGADGAPQQDRIVGGVFASGPSLMTGYLDGQPSPIRDGWLDTGDLGFLDQGELYVTGRSKDVIILRGRNHAPHDVERTLDAVPGVRTGCSIAVGEVTSEGEQLVVFVETRQDRPGLLNDCRAAILAGTGLTPTELVSLLPGTLPRTSSGKLRRAEALRSWRDGSLSAPDKVTVGHAAKLYLRGVLGHLRT